jgi:hypothetical protein
MNEQFSMPISDEDIDNCFFDMALVDQAKHEKTKEVFEELLPQIHTPVALIAAKSFVSGIQAMCPKITEKAALELFNKHREEISADVKHISVEITKIASQRSN